MWTIEIISTALTQKSPKHGSSDGSAFASRSKGHGFESRMILLDTLLSE